MSGGQGGDEAGPDLVLEPRVTRGTVGVRDGGQGIRSGLRPLRLARLQISDRDKIDY